MQIMDVNQLEGIQRSEKVRDGKCPTGFLKVLRSLLEKTMLRPFFPVLQNTEGQNWGDRFSGGANIKSKGFLPTVEVYIMEMDCFTRDPKRDEIGGRSKI